jgi:hypothetical protein
MFYQLLLAVTLFGQQTPQLEIIPYKDSTPGTLRFYENRSNARNFAAIRAEDTVSTDCTYRISDVAFIPCVGYQVGIGRSGTRWDSLYSRFIDLTSSSAPSPAQFFVRRFSNAGFISAVDTGASEMEFTVSNGGNEKFFVGESVSRLGVSLDAQQVRPTITSTYSLGTNSRRWANAFTDFVTITTGFRLGTSSTAGWVLTTDASGNGAWAAPTGGGTPGGSGSEIQFRAGASTFGAVTGSSVSGGQITLGDTLFTNAVRPTTGSAFSLGTTGARWTNSFFDRITLSTGAGFGFTTTIKPSAAYSFNIGDTTDYWNLVYARVLNLQSQSAFSPAAINIRDSSANLLFSMSDAGSAVGDFRVYDAGVPKFEVYSGQTNITTTNLQITGTTTHTGTIQFSVDALYNIGSSPSRANQVWMSQSRATAYYYNGSLGVTGTYNFGTCVATVTSGGITATAGVC